MHRRRLVRVPASSANLGPGFDVLAAALALHVELEVEETGRFAVHTDLQIARDRRNLAVRAFETLHPADDFEFTIRSDVPLSGGLGTSAAAYVAGLMAADSVFELDAPLLATATKLEGHPDNAAAAMLGGFVVCVGARAALEPFSGGSSYAISKASVLALVRALDADYREEGIRANAILPSVIDTPANRESMPDADYSKWVTPAQIARVIRFLCSADSAPVSGAAIPVYGRA
jgi:homoserine kinase